MSNNSTIESKEVKKFAKYANQWWNDKGSFAPLHKFNPVRIKFFTEHLAFNFAKNKNIKLLDIGCGGGLVSESLATLGYEVTGIDVVAENIITAKNHAKFNNLNITYLNQSIEEHLKSHTRHYDVVICSEVIEHIKNPKVFLHYIDQIRKRDSLVFITTINRTVKSLLTAKFAAEYILQWLPKGTHDWNKFLKPCEIIDFSEDTELDLQKMVGFSFNLFSDKWKITDDFSVNYAMMFR
jgi:2-polyprenyl-6-hydroxyphenyl methylase / 3-demethylubiquinone-9 3-methyltransferase